MDYRYTGEVQITLGNVTLLGNLDIPSKARSIVIFSHGSGSSRHSPRNRQVAQYLQQRGMGTLLLDLLTEEEDRDYQKRFQIDLLTKRLVSATLWLEAFPAAAGCKLGYFGASTGAASALKAAAQLKQIRAVVSRGGRPDLAMDKLPQVEAPTLLIVGSLDTQVLELNQEAFRQLACEKKLEVVSGATHLFEEAGKMDIVSALAAGWFMNTLEGVQQVHAT